MGTVIHHHRDGESDGNEGTSSGAIILGEESAGADQGNAIVGPTLPFSTDVAVATLHHHHPDHLSRAMLDQHRFMRGKEEERRQQNFYLFCKRETVSIMVSVLY